MSGHGWVTARPDGGRARCGGPGLCTACSTEWARLRECPRCKHAPHLEMCGHGRRPDDITAAMCACPTSLADQAGPQGGGATVVPTSAWGRGAWMQTYTGIAFTPLQPRPEDVRIEDIAHALSLICRYGGHVNRFYSVAEHCIHVSRNVPPEHALVALLHDSAEAYVGDMVRPLKREIPHYRDIEQRVLKAIWERFGLERRVDPVTYWPATVDEADNRILLDERDALLSEPPMSWQQEGLQPLGVDLMLWTPLQAERFFLERFRELDNTRSARAVLSPDDPAVLASTEHAVVELYKPSGKYYTSEVWRIPDREQVLAGGGTGGDSVSPYCMRFSPDFRRISGGHVQVVAQEPWGYPHLLPGGDDTCPGGC